MKGMGGRGRMSGKVKGRGSMRKFGDRWKRMF